MIIVEGRGQRCRTIDPGAYDKPGTISTVAAKT
jgi:hypothetical protein